MAWDIPVYKAEREAGLEQAIRASARMTYASLAEVAEPFTLNERITAHLKEQAKATNLGQPDLFYLKTLMVSTGWNKNDDVFDRVETWKARHTPEDKPFNYEHDCTDIIGHITSNHVVGEDMKIIADDTLVDDVPNSFHVVTGAVLYKDCWDRDRKDLIERIEKTISEIREGKWFVSMEALFSDYDYALVSSGGAKVVARNEKTAFLSKHLRCLGGEGVYQGQKVGRLLRNFVFSGKGLVRKPANPASIIFPESETFKVDASTDFERPQNSLGYESVNAESKESNTNMAITELEIAQKTIADLQAKCDKLEVSLRDNDTKQFKAAAEAQDKKIAELAEQVKVLSEAKAKADEDSKSVAVKLADVEKQLADKTEALAKVEAERKQAARQTAIEQKLELTAEKAKVLAEKYAKLDDETFDATIQAQADYMADKKSQYAAAKPEAPKNVETPLTTPAVKPQPKATDKPTAPKATDKPLAPNTVAASEAVEEDPKGEKAAASVNLDEAKKTADVALASATEEAGVTKVRADILNYFGCKTEGEE